MPRSRPGGRWRPMIAMALLALSLAPPYASAARPSAGPRDVTATDAGRAFAADAAARVSRRYGIEMPADSFTVWQVGDRLVAGPRGAGLTVHERRRRDGTVARTYHASEAPARVAQVDALAAPAAAASESTGWQLVGSSCWIDDHEQGSWMDVCYHKYRATSDGSGRYDYYALNMFSTFAAPQFGLEVGDPWIEARPGKGAAHTWHDWDPREDTTLPCTSTVSLEVAVQGVPLTVDASQCATWDITKYAAAGTFRNAWREGLCMMRQGETSLEFEIASRVAQNAVPTWTFRWYEEADLAACTF